MQGLTGRALFDPEPLINPQQAAWDRRKFRQMAANENLDHRIANGKLTESQIEAAVKMYDDGASVRKCAEKFGIKQQSMHDLLKRRTKLRTRAEAARMRVRKVAA